MRCHFKPSRMFITKKTDNIKYGETDEELKKLNIFSFSYIADRFGNFKTGTSYNAGENIKWKTVCWFLKK